MNSAAGRGSGASMLTETEPAAAAAGRILVVEADAGMRDAVCRALAEVGHDVSAADGVASALDLLARVPFDLVLTELRLGGASGLDLLVEVRSRAPATRLILTSSSADLPRAAAAVGRGIDHLLLKPYDAADLRARVDDSLHRRRAEREQAREREVLEARIRQRDTEAKIWVLRAAHALAAAVEAKDPFIAGHARRVTAYAMTIAERTGGIDLVSFRLAGDLHDVGKIGVPDRVLRKPDRLTRREMEAVRKHTVIGARILGPLIDDRRVLDVVRSHHERWDGRGYPDGLAGEAIPFSARVLSVADTLDAMTSRRAYRDGVTWEQAVDLVRDCAGTQFDPGVVEAFDAVLPLLEAHYRRFRAEGLPVPPDEPE